MRIIPSDAAHDGPWSFLSLVLLPDIAAWRFPDCHAARLTGTYRDVFRRTWWRRYVLGDLVDDRMPGDRALGEDELVNIFERSRMARSHHLVRALAEHVLAADYRDRSHYAREVAKRVRRLLAYINVDVLDNTGAASIVDKAATAVLAARQTAG